MINAAIPVYAGLFVIALGLALEIRGWVRGSKLISRQQKIYRVAAAAMLSTVLLMMLYSPAVHARKDPLFEIIYLGSLTMIGALIVVIALLDVKATLISYREQRREIFQGVFRRERREDRN